MNPPQNKVIDHINGNKLDNRRENLRILTPMENSGNQKKKLNTTSTFLGVYYNIKLKKYEARVNYNCKRYNIGYYKTDIEAAEMRDIYVIKYNLNHLRLNFPDKKDEYIKSEHKFDKPNKSNQYFGVCKTSNDKFRAIMFVNKKNIHIGTSSNEYDCACMYDKYIIDNNILGKTLNFPENNNCNKTIKTLCEIIDDNTIKLLIQNKENKCVKMDKNDYDLIKYYKCFINASGYASVNINGKYKLLHRIIMNVNSPDIFIDHINNNISDNTRNNLRLSNCKKNAQNKSKTKSKSTSKYIGIYYCKKINRWYGSIELEYKRIYKKSDISEDIAARRRDLYIMDNLKDTHFKLNFEWTQDEIDEWKNKLDYNMPTETSKYFGISYVKHKNSWVSIIKINNKITFRKYNKNEMNLARMRDLFILENLKDTKIKLNFTWTQDEINEWKTKLTNGKQN